MRSSVPSGSTMCLRSARALLSSSYSNISGVTTSGRSTSRLASSEAASTFCSKSARAVSTLRWESLVTRPRADAAALAERKVPRSVWMIGTLGSRSAMRRLTASGGRKPPLRMMPASDGKFLAVCAVRRPSRTSVRSPGVMTTAPSASLSSRFSKFMAPTRTSSTSRPRSASSPRSRRPPTAPMSCPTVGATRKGSSGMVQTGSVSPANSARMASRSSGKQRFATTPMTCAWLDWSSETETSLICRIPAGERSLPESTSSTGAPRLAAIRALKASSVGPVTSV